MNLQFCCLGVEVLTEPVSQAKSQLLPSMQDHLYLFYAVREFPLFYAVREFPLFYAVREFPTP